MSRIIYANDGGVAVITPAPGNDIAIVTMRAVPAGVTSVVVEDSVIPADRSFRNAWELSGSTILVNLVKAKAIAIAKIRERALVAIKKAEEQTMLNEIVTHTAASISAALALAKTNIANAIDVAAIKVAMDSFEHGDDSNSEGSN